MNDPTDIPAVGHDLRDILFNLDRSHRELRADLEHLRRQLAGEVRTRRLVVVEEDGFERVEIAAGGAFGHVKANCRGGNEGEATYIVLQAGEEEGAIAAVTLMAGGNVKGSFDVVELEDGAFGSSVYVTGPPEPPAEPGQRAADTSEPRSTEPVNWSAPTSCSCEEEFELLQTMHHEWLLSIEEDGAAGIASLVEYLVSDQEMGTEKGLLRWGQFPDFVACHNWREPMAMFRLADVLNLLLQVREEWWVTKTGSAAALREDEVVAAPDVLNLAVDDQGKVEVLPGFSIDRQVVLAINDSREEVIEAGRQLLGVLQRAHAASSAGYNTVKAHPDEDPDELWAKIPGLEALVDAVYAVRELAGLFSNVTPAWPATFDGSPVDC